MISRSDAEGLEVIHQHSGLEVVHQHSGLEYNGPSASDHSSSIEHHYKPTPNAETFLPELHQASPGKRTCGLRRRTFWLAAGLLALTVLAAAIGGGIGGSLTNRSKQNTTTSPIGQASASSSLAATIATSSTGTRPPTSISTIVDPSATLLRDCPSSNNTIYTVHLGFAKQQYRKACSTSFAVTKSASENFVRKFTTSLNECIGLCAQWNVNDHKSTSGLAQTCGAVCWRNNFDNDYPGVCFGYAVSNSSDGSFRMSPDTNCDSAVWMNEP